ncbi:Dolichyl-phosphate beta-glucosyltransferase [Pseudolycoriella hygida]|uniref:Dolichyl-phosphate beta-glucosyltransferase n=1 Tax=Pseudolycoriella hygida TaxID=35572 RepID=A0A9Q0S7B1_9DIPT|nr:Dolichyl-phosphate beta-glucosyltransferase [Pseudolycoriella hygida]
MFYCYFNCHAVRELIIKMLSLADPQIILFYGSAFLVTFVIAIFICVKAITTPHPIIKRYKEEENFFDPKTKTNEPFPSISENPEIDYSIIVPAYDEEKRLPVMLDEAIEFLEKKDCLYEIIIVSDGISPKNNFI